ncbi:EYES ABSENT-like protein [Raphanus sativus]|uniref:protein-tyrosine-phosphatase n=1 Tax=Raphanus sativus TaxID=3726 RepID=A0A6J0LJD2_RAPSA|nr:eyes absent homolog [Raphanus sativus]XP_018459515.1 eyes absent homolog [Raphanus sativus]XP_056861620.1 eyes absent homolog [Raphanus sativus]XP_056861621.1 eyes absent homolog [Raphanus sativus]KAJ4868701.1 EYES ABSENT-like protein [Raphanus sativus]KAJ4907056.1 EYES ABSENT-like protein [Raphanus sativus]
MNANTSQNLEALASDGGGPVNVYIWDMDETLILLRSLLNGTYAESFNGSKDVKRGVEIGEMWEKHILKICDDCFFYEQVEDCNEAFIDSLREYDDGKDLSRYDFKQDGFTSPTDDLNKRKLAYRHRAVARRYEKGLAPLVDSGTMSVLDDLYEVTDGYTDRWLSSAKDFLEQCSNVKEASSDGTIDQSSQDIHILVTSGALIPSLVKCLLFRLDTFLRHENVYSSIDVGKLQCFKWIKERYNHPKFRFCAIGDGWEECAAAQTMQWPFVKIDYLQPDSSYRFPGVTPKTVSYYFAAVYGNSDADTNKE